jgi:CTP synthase (UTP-ammonia lyase)
MLNIGLIGDFDESVPAHRAIPLALRMAAEEEGVSVSFEWVPTDQIVSSDRVSRFDGLWCVPASPYRSMEGALRAIRFARESGRPFIGTCGGFQHAVIELARNVLGWADAEHAETAPDAHRPVITLLECALVEASDTVRLVPGSRLHAAYGRDEAVEGYRCRYGLNAAFIDALTSAGLRIAARDKEGEIRGLELSGHPFFVLTLFQPERAALRGECPPLITAYLRALRERAGSLPGAKA